MLSAVQIWESWFERIMRVNAASESEMVTSSNASVSRWRVFFFFFWPGHSVIFLLKMEETSSSTLSSGMAKARHVTE